MCISPPLQFSLECSRSTPGSPRFLPWTYNFLYNKTRFILLFCFFYFFYFFYFYFFFLFRFSFFSFISLAASPSRIQLLPSLRMSSQLVAQQAGALAMENFRVSYLLSFSASTPLSFFSFSRSLCSSDRSLTDSPRSTILSSAS